MGEVLFPAYWFHYIISQDASIQCNCRSGNSRVGEAEINQCMQKVSERQKGKRLPIFTRQERVPQGHLAATYPDLMVMANKMVIIAIFRMLSRPASSFKAGKYLDECRIDARCDGS